MLCFRNFPLAKKFLDKRWGGGDQYFSVGNLLSYSAETSRSGILCCFFNFGGYVTTLCRNFLSRSTKMFRRGTILCCISEIFR